MMSKRISWPSVAPSTCLFVLTVWCLRSNVIATNPPNLYECHCSVRNEETDHLIHDFGIVWKCVPSLFHRCTCDDLRNCSAICSTQFDRWNTHALLRNTPRCGIRISFDTIHCGHESVADLSERKQSSVGDNIPVVTVRNDAVQLHTGDVLVTGGSNLFYPYYFAAIFNLSLATWKVVPPLDPPRSEHRAVLLPSTLVLFTGGYNHQGALKKSELYDPSSNAWLPTPDMTEERYWHTITLLPSGKVLATGGGDLYHARDSCEAYDPISNTWAAVDSMNLPRDQHTATLLSEGQVLVIV